MKILYERTKNKNSERKNKWTGLIKKERKKERKKVNRIDEKVKEKIDKNGGKSEDIKKQKANKSLNIIETKQKKKK